MRILKILNAGNDIIISTCLLLILCIFLMNPAYAAQSASTVVSLDYQMAANLNNTDIELSRLSVSSQTRLRLNRDWSAQFEARAEAANDDVGLGTTNGYSAISRPIVDNSTVRVEIDRAFIEWRNRAHSLRVGKQVTPWGVLDGVQITDRFDPVRRRDFVFTDVRPNRIARWGARWRNQLGNFKLDASVALDGSVSQQAEQGAIFFTSSTRFTGGLDVSTMPVVISTESRSSVLKQSTYGLRVSYPLAQGDLSLLSFRGPDTDPLLSLLAPPSFNQAIAVELTYPRRTLYGATYDVTLGETVLRGELAYIPNQPVNVISGIPLQSSQARRVLAGVGLDWNAPNQWFVNIQLAVDYLSLNKVEAQPAALLRPATDTILTVRAQRLLLNGRLLFKNEILGTLNQRDGVLRPELAYEYTDHVKIRAGVDWVFGNTNGQFGQFKDSSRLWFAAAYTF